MYIPLAELVDGLGPRIAETVMDAVGGQRIYVPGKLEEDGQLVSAMGTEAAAKLIDYIRADNGGMHIELPMGSSGQEALRQAQMLEACKDASKSASRLARELGVHDRTIRRWRSKLRRLQAASA